MPEERVNIISAQYIAQTDTVFWEVETKSGDIYPLQWQRNKFGEAFSIKGAEDIAPALLVEFCEKMIGKDMNLIIEHDEPLPEHRKT